MREFPAPFEVVEAGAALEEDLGVESKVAVADKEVVVVVVVGMTGATDVVDDATAAALDRATEDGATELDDEEKEAARAANSCAVESSLL